ncbi:MAG: regulatory protein RecX [Bdellovibrionales bacterium]|nr:regulatory protein RecX [Bdellovibrionales bacterium]
MKPGEIERSDNLAMAIDQLARYLARREHSELELQEKLTRDFMPDTVGKALACARERKWLSDPAELAERVAVNLSAKRKGQLYIQNYLRRKGLPGVKADEGQELSKARELVEMRFARNLDFALKQKAYRFLANRGFEDQIIKKVLYEKP